MSPLGHVGSSSLCTTMVFQRGAHVPSLCVGHVLCYATCEGHLGSARIRLAGLFCRIVSRGSALLPPSLSHHMFVVRNSDVSCQDPAGVTFHMVTKLQGKRNLKVDDWARSIASDINKGQQCLESERMFTDPRGHVVLKTCHIFIMKCFNVKQRSLQRIQNRKKVQVKVKKEQPKPVVFQAHIHSYCHFPGLSAGRISPVAERDTSVSTHVILLL